MNEPRTLQRIEGPSLRLYPPIWFLLFAATAVALDWLVPVKLPLRELTQPLAMLLAASGGGMAIWAAWLFRHHRTTAHPYAEASQLVTRGPFRVTRNPMYLGLLLALIALALWLQSLPALLLAPLFVGVINRCNILPEERRLSSRFGTEYEAYLAHTRRWL